MTAGQYEQYAAQAAAELELYPPDVERVVKLVGPRIAEDTRDRLVAAAGEAVCRDADLRQEWSIRRHYFCGEWVTEFTGTEQECDTYLQSAYESLPADRHHLIHKAHRFISDWQAAS